MAQSVFKTCYYAVLEGGASAGVGAHASFNNGVLRFKVQLAGGFSGGIGVTRIHNL